MMLYDTNPKHESKFANSMSSMLLCKVLLAQAHPTMLT